MSHVLTDDTKTIIMLCGVIGSKANIKPLTLVEYTRLVAYLKGADIRPHDLLTAGSLGTAALAADLEEHRLEALLSRGVQLGFAVEEWHRDGIWVISRSDPAYPTRIKRHLKDKAPPLLYGAGNSQLMLMSGLGIVGSRNVDPKGVLFTKEAARQAVQNKLAVVSGGARGVDQTAMDTALQYDGFSIGILAEQLLKKSLEQHNRQAIAQGRLLLISPYHPHAHFTVGTAMARNKLIYAMADYTLVVSAEHQKGGTWAGATEELSRTHARPVFIRDDEQAPSGNRKLLEFGGLAWPKTFTSDLGRQLQVLSTERNNRSHQTKSEPETQDLFSQEDRAKTSKGNGQPMSVLLPHPFASTKPTCNSTNQTIYESVLPIILEEMAEPATTEELAKSLDVEKNQLAHWLKKGVAEKKITKLSHPVRYQRTDPGPRNIHSARLG